MNRSLKLLIFPLVFLVGLTCFSHRIGAESINYRTYKYGTKQTSMADGYYAKPAQIQAAGKQYLITMTIRTKASLSPYPVKVLIVNGQSPLKVVKSRHGSDYDYRYSFYANDLKQTISSKIKINVPGIYQASHKISFLFDTSHLPKLGVAKIKSQNKERVKTKPVKTSKAKPSSRVNGQQEEKKRIQLADKQIAQNEKNHRENIRHQKMFYYVILGGILSSIVLIVIAGFVIVNSKKAKEK